MLISTERHIRLFLRCVSVTTNSSIYSGEIERRASVDKYVQPIPQLFSRRSLSDFVMERQRKSGSVPTVYCDSRHHTFARPKCHSGVSAELSSGLCENSCWQAKMRSSGIRRILGSVCLKFSRYSDDYRFESRTLGVLPVFDHHATRCV